MATARAAAVSPAPLPRPSHHPQRHGHHATGFSSTHLLTDLAPANALVQRWGRCARWGGTGKIMVFAPPEGEPAQAQPYAREEELPDILTRTAAWLMDHRGITLDTAAERDLLEMAHGESDARWVKGLRDRFTARSPLVGQTIAAGDYSAAGPLIRPQDTRTVLVHGDPSNEAGVAAHEAIATRPFTCTGFRISPGMLRRLARGERGEVEDDDGAIVSLAPPPALSWRVQVAEFGRGDEESERDADRGVTWQPVSGDGALNAPLFVLNPALATYSRRLGLSFNATPPNAVAPEFWARQVGAGRKTTRTSDPGVGYETLTRHVERMLAVLAHDPALWPRVGPVAATVERWCGWPPGLLWRVVEAAVLLHDAGKLTPAWQRMIAMCQEKAGNPVEPWLVHTGPRAILPGLWNRDRLPHALAGAAYSLAVGEALDAAAGDTARVQPSRVLFTVIATHHSADLSDWRIGESCELLAPGGRTYLDTLLTAHGFSAGVARVMAGRSYGGYRVLFAELPTSDDAAEPLATLLVTRLLRLADGWSQERARLDEEKLLPI